MKASLILWEGEKVLQIPSSALFRHADDWAVFVLNGDRAHIRPVQIDHNNGFAAEIKTRSIWMNG